MLCAITDRDALFKALEGFELESIDVIHPAEHMVNKGLPRRRDVEMETLDVICIAGRDLLNPSDVPARVHRARDDAIDEPALTGPNLFELAAARDADLLEQRVVRDGRLEGSRMRHVR